MARFFRICILALLMAGCAAREFGGISFSPGAVEPELQHLAMRAERGDKRALLELGIRFEEGRGVRPDLAFAERLYARAATSDPGVIYIYQPPIRPNTMGTVMPFQTGSRSPGLAEARERLEAVRRLRAKL